ncbi:MAG: ABC transporter ATP-binding protein, partial [Burkholderiales bacterium]
MSEAPVIEVNAIVTRFDAQTVHDGVSFTVPRGQIAALIGGSGSGKTVLLREIIGLHRPNSGRVRLLGTDVWSAPEEELAALRQRFGMLFQDGALFSSLTVAQNVATPLIEHARVPAHLLGPLVRLRIALAGLPVDAATKMPSELSGGMRKRAAVARALALEPEVLFLDEPTTGLDPKARRDLWSVIEGFRREGRTVFLTTHYLDEADALSDRLYIVEEGRVLAQGTAEELKRQVGGTVRVSVKDGGSIREQMGTFGPVVSEDGTIHVVTGPERVGELVEIAMRRGLSATVGPVSLEEAFLR